MTRPSNVSKAVASKRPAKNKNQQDASNLKAKVQKKSKGLTKEEDKKARRFRPIVQALRNMRKQQKMTNQCMKNAPMVRLVKGIASECDSRSWLRPSAIETIKEIATAETIKLLRLAFGRRLENMTEAELGPNGKQVAVQVMGKNIIGAFSAWADERSGDFMDVFMKTYRNERSKHPSKLAPPLKTKAKKAPVQTGA